MIRSIRDHGSLEIRLAKAQARVFDYLLSRYLGKNPSEMQTRDRLMNFFRFFANLGNAYHLWFTYPRLGIFNFVFDAERPLHCRRTENDGEVLYLFKKR